MPFTITVDESIPLVHLEGSGVVSLTDLCDVLTTLIAMGVVEMPRLVDFSGTTLHVSAVQVRAYARFKQTHLSSYKVVRVAAIAPDQAVFDTLRTYQGLVWQHEPDYYIFRTLEEGMTWLQNPEPG